MNEPFIQMIHLHPREQMPRGVYADWLEENGEALKAEFIRLKAIAGTLQHVDKKQVRMLKFLFGYQKKQCDPSCELCKTIARLDEIRDKLWPASRVDDMRAEMACITSKLQRTSAFMYRGAKWADVLRNYSQYGLTHADAQTMRDWFEYHGLVTTPR